jgi:hypothetical protein
MELGSGETDFGSSRGYDWERERAVGALHDEILSLLVVNRRQSGVAARASTLSAENQHERRA